MASVTALVHTKNSAETLEKCLKSLSFVDHLIVIDMESSDDSVKIAKKQGATVLEHKDVGYVEPARQFALKHVKTDWTLIVDSDEEVPATLAAKLKELTTDSTAADVYLLPRRNIVFNKWIEHSGWWPDYQLRFFKTGSVTWPIQIHAQPGVSGKVVQLEAKAELALTHHNYQTIEQFIERMNRYTTIEVDRGQSGSTAQSTRGPAHLPSEFSGEFASRFFASEGYLDGGHGLALAYLQSMYQVIVELKRWQASGFPDNQNPAELVEKVSKSLKELQYWTTSYSIQRTTGLQKLIWTVRRKLRW